MKRFCLVVLLAACGSDNSNMKTPDASTAKDAPAQQSTIQAVTCPASPAATVTSTDGTFMYSPAMVTISQGQIVKFVMSGSHNAAPGHAQSDSTVVDPGLTVGFGTTKCLMFTQTGSFGFHCVPHGFNGTVTVQ